MKLGKLQMGEEIYIFNLSQQDCQRESFPTNARHDILQLTETEIEKK